MISLITVNIFYHFSMELTNFIPSTQSSKGYYRFPALHQQTLIFTAEGDLWRLDLSSDIPYRLTTHHGMEHHAHISPDGQWVAFCGQYEGYTEVYLLPITGGIPKRITYESALYSFYVPVVRGWTPDGNILYSSGKYATLPNRQLIEINPFTREEKLIPLSQADQGCFDDEKKWLYFTRLPFQGSHTRRYKGGSIQQLWKFAEGEGEAIPLTTDYPGTSRRPMWYDGRLYFVSDRDGMMNIWSIDADGHSLTQHTFSTHWDIKHPSLSQGKMVYQKGADVYELDLSHMEERLVPIQLISDFDQKRTRWIKQPINRVSHVNISPKGDQVVFTTRGRIFVAPTKGGRWKEVTRKSGIRYESAKFLGKQGNICMLSDESGEMEIWSINNADTGESEQLSQHGAPLIRGLTPSPDGKYIAYYDKDQRLEVLNVETKEAVVVEQNHFSGIYDYRWSPDSQFIAYTSGLENTHSIIKIYHIQTQQSDTLTSERVDSYYPIWSDNGKWLYFLSDREFSPVVKSPWGPRQPEPFYHKMTKIYAIDLVGEQRFPFLEPDELYLAEQEAKEKKKKEEANKETDTAVDPKEEKKSSSKEKGLIFNTPSEVEVEEQNANGEEDRKEDSNAKEKKESKDKDPEPIVLKREGLKRRLYEVPLEGKNFYQLMVGNGFLYWTEKAFPDEEENVCYALKIEWKSTYKPTEIGKAVYPFKFSQNRKKILIKKKKEYYVIDADGKVPKWEEKKISLKNWSFQVNPQEDWRQMLRDAWRLMRDYFYDKSLHKVDWANTLERHLPLVDRVTDRYELDDLMAHMVAELSTLHTFVVGGDRRNAPERIRLAYLGAKLERDVAAEGYRIAHIYQSDPDYPDELSPLAQPHISINEGDVIRSINGIPLLEVPDPSLVLPQKEDQQVRVSVRREDGTDYEAIVYPISATEDQHLRYNEWEYTRRLQVEAADERLGYVHLRAMSGHNYTEWIRQYYPVFHRKGLIIDVRHNRGGNIDSWILGKLLRQAWAYWQPRHGAPYWNMQYAFRGHMVVLCNEETASDGEAFSEGFRRMGLGKVIGTRTWGGGIWLTSSNRLVDYGIATASEIGMYTAEGEWLVEGHGVDPDIVVDNLPHATFQGKDAQLEAAIEHLQRLLEEDPKEVPSSPPYPDKSFAVEKH